MASDDPFDAGPEQDQALAPVPKPGGVERFYELADRLYGELEQYAGGPLHVELEDHNTDGLTGAKASRNRAHMAEALALIESGEAPRERPKSIERHNAGGQLVFEWPPGHEVSHYAFYYRDEPDALRVCIDILTITEPWTEEQAEAAYAAWMRQGEGPCSCQTYPDFTEEEQP